MQGNKVLRLDVFKLITLEKVKIVDLTCRAKYLIIHTEKGYIIGHLGISGSMQILPQDSEIDKPCPKCGGKIESLVIVKPHSFFH